MLTYKPNIVLSTKEYNVVGTRPIRQDGAEKVTGRAAYGADVRLPGLLYGKILAKSPTPMPVLNPLIPGTLRKFQGSMPSSPRLNPTQPSGRVVDLAEGTIHNIRFLSNNIMAADKVLYKGHAVAAGGGDESPHC